MPIGTDIERIQQVLTEALMNEWELQGHAMTSAVVKDIEYVVKQETNRLSISGMIYPYGNIIAAGTKSGKIPYSGRSGKGGTSLYIAALQRYVKQRMNINDEQKSKSIAFAIATEQKKHGMPTPGSYNYSKSGKRIDWVEEAFMRSEEKIKEAIRQMAFNLLSVNIDVLLKKWNYELNRNL